MAQFDSTTINTVELVHVVNNVVNSNLLQISKSRDVLLDAALGRSVEGNGPLDAQYEKLRTVTGLYHEVPILDGGATFAGVADGSGGEGGAVSTQDVGSMGSFQFQVAHLIANVALYDNQLKRFRGKEAKLDFMKDVSQFVIDGAWKELSTQLHATGASKTPSRTVFGSWVAAVSDGSTAAGTQSDYATYGQINRAAAGNTNFKGYVKDAASATLTLAMLADVIDEISTKGGHADIGVANKAQFTKLRSLLETNAVPVIKDSVIDFSGEYLRYGGVTFGLSGNCPSGHVGVFDSETWAMIKEEGDLVTVEDAVRNPSVKAARLMHCAMWLQMICKAPNRNGKIVALA